MRCTERCPNCPSNGLHLGAKAVVSGDWDGHEHPRTHILFIGEAPGREENNRHRVFIGKTGDEFNNTYLPQAGLSRSVVSMTNTVKCHWADTGDAPPEALVKSCSEWHLKRELAYNNPDIAVLMGGTANSLLNLDVDMEHGHMRRGELLGWKGVIYSTFHPALGLHMPAKMKALLDDFRYLKRVFRGEVEPLIDQTRTSFARITDPCDVGLLMEDRYNEDIAVDTESMKRWRGYKSTTRYIPYNVSFSNEVGTGYMVKVCDQAALTTFFTELRKYRRVTFHNAPYDYGILVMMLQALGREDLMVDWSRVLDTMSMAYFDGRMAKGLKPMSYGLTGYRMTSFDDTVVPHSRLVALKYLAEVLTRDWPKAIQVPTGGVKYTKCKDCKGKSVLSMGRGKLKRMWDCGCGTGWVLTPTMTRKQSIGDKLWRLAGDLAKKPDIDLWERWEGWETDVQPLIDSDLGPINLPSIEHVPEAEQIEYACGDSHQTLRLIPIMLKRLAVIRRTVFL